MLVNGLRLQLALFYVLLSLPALLLIERVVFGWKFEHMLQQLDDGRVDALLAQEARVLARELRQPDALDAERLRLRLENLVLRLERPRESLGTSAAFVLLELTPHPFEAALRLPNAATVQAGAAPSPAPSWVRRHWRQAFAAPGGEAELVLELAVPSPWRASLETLSFEWRLAVAYLLVFLLGSAAFLRWRVLQRVSRMADAAGAWARGDFGMVLDDRSGDELGRLSRALDRMALDVQAMVDARASLASLEERQRLARDLHDTVKQKAFALALQLAAARDSAGSPKAARCLADAQTLVAEIQAELAQLLHERRAGAEPDAALSARMDLVPELARRIDDFARRSGLRCECALPTSCPLPVEVAETALRVFDEAASNIWRHAAATEVRIELTRDAADFDMRIEDNGRGFVIGEGRGMGLDSMQARARGIGARLEIDSRPGEGTRLRLHVGAA